MLAFGRDKRQPMVGRHGAVRSGTCACRKPIGWRLTENRAMLICNERSCQAHCVGGCRSVSVAGSDRGRDFNVAAADHCSATNRPKEAILRCHRPVGVRWSLSPLPSRSLMRLRLLGPRPSSNGTVRASVCTGVNQRRRGPHRILSESFCFRWLIRSKGGVPIGADRIPPDY